MSALAIVGFFFLVLLSFWLIWSGIRALTLAGLIGSREVAILGAIMLVLAFVIDWFVFAYSPFRAIIKGML